MNCPHCGTLNEPGNQFCISCGQSLSGAPPSGGGPYGQSPGDLLTNLALRTLIALLGLWILHAILTQLPFVRLARIPDIPLTLPAMISILIYLVAFFLLMGFSRVLRALWPVVFPNLAGATLPFALLVYLLALLPLYNAIAPIVEAFTIGADALTVVQVIFVILAVILVGGASYSLYQQLPVWIRSIRRLIAPAATDNVACLNCGHLNAKGQKHCGNCGHQLAAVV